MKGLIGVALIAGSPVAYGQVTLSGVPDFSQRADVSWANYCGPTNGTNVAYYFAQTYASLGGPLPPNLGADLAANGIVNDMAARMGTTLTGGTSALGMQNGLDSYLEDNWDGTGGGTDWDTVYHDGAVIGGGGLEAAIQNALSNGDGVIMLIRWDNALGGPPQGGGYDTPDNYDGGSQPAPNAAMGHAVTAVGYQPGLLGIPNFSYNDPANNVPLAAHNWGGEGTATTYTINPFDVTLNSAMGGATAIVYGAVTTNIPAPGAAVMFGLGVLGSRRRRR